jgi:hypothetical protein
MSCGISGNVIGKKDILLPVQANQPDLSPATRAKNHANIVTMDAKGGKLSSRCKTGNFIGKKDKFSLVFW